MGQLAGCPPAGARRLSRHHFLVANSSEISTIGSAYRALCCQTYLSTFPLWKVPLPLKIKIFVWQLQRDRLPFGTSVIKWHGPGDGMCPLCVVSETGSHIFFSCTRARVLWSFVREALRPDYEDLDLYRFLQTYANQTGRGGSACSGLCLRC